MIQRLRVFAGPNGSGKSTIKSAVPIELLGVYINPDELELELCATNRIDLNRRHIEVPEGLMTSFLENSQLAKQVVLEQQVSRIYFQDGTLYFEGIESPGYLASIASDILRQALLASKQSFTFETVLSHPSKVEFMRQAQLAGYRTYLYFVATEDADINVSRVHNRVRLGGHDVPEEKIRTRYKRSLNLLLDAIRVSNRAYIFDNSGQPGSHFLIAEVTGGSELEIMTDVVPDWFNRAVLEKIS